VSGTADLVAMDQEKLQFYKDLQKEYDLILDRRKNLNAQATSLMSFTGIIQTVLVGFMIALATNDDARAFVTTQPNFHLLMAFIAAGFVCYIATAILALLALWEKKWNRIPQLPKPLPAIVREGSLPKQTAELDEQKPAKQKRPTIYKQIDEANVVLDKFFESGCNINFRLFVGQIVEANLKHMQTNSAKFNRLNGASLALIVGIILTALGGFVMLSMVMSA
jgi:hypothetical protein